MKTSKWIKSSACLLVSAALILGGVQWATGQDAPKPRSSIVVGQQAPSFHAKALDGKAINFPGDYKGKIVMLDFWATWCPPCRAELPNVSATYQKYHTNGFDIVSISLDKPQQGPAVLKFIGEHNMPWAQIYDGGYWKAALAVQYDIHAIPCPLVVDGDTGKVLAVGAGAVGSHLQHVVESALAAKKK